MRSLAEFSHQAERSVGEALGAAKQAGATAVEGAGRLLHGVRQAAGVAAHKTQEGLGHLKDKAPEYLEQGKKELKALGQTIERHVQQHPVPTLLLAAGIGAFVAVVGVIAFRR